MSAVDHRVTSYWNPVRITFGAGSLAKLPECIPSRAGGRPRVTLITGQAIMRELGILARVRDMLDGVDLTIYEGVEPNPELDKAQEALDFAREHAAEVVVGIGGGSALDTAKIVAFLLPNGAGVREYFEAPGRWQRESLPAVLIPTTAGTGSEVTRWGTLWDAAAKKKYSVEHPSMYPAHAILDPKLTLTLPAVFTATTGADALSHAMEAYWNRNANPVSDHYALEAVRRIFEALPLVVSDPGNVEYRSRMLFASLLAGLAFSNTKTAAAHSLSYPMTLHYGMIHGQASSITLPALLRFNAEASRERMTDLAKATGGSSIESGAKRIQVLLQRVGLKTSLSDLGIDRSGIDVCVREGYTPDRAGHNLRELTAGGLREVLEMVA